MKNVRHVFVALLGAAVISTGSSIRAFGQEAGLSIPHNTPKFAATAKNLGAVDPSTVIDVSIWLKPHNKSDMDALAKELYDKSSPNYRHWLTKKDFAARYAPTADEVKKVQQFFTTNKLSVVSTGPDNFYVRGRGTAASVSSAFHVALNNYEVGGQKIRGNAADPKIVGEAGALVASISGLDSLGYVHPMISRAGLGVKAKTTTPTAPGVSAGLKSAATAAAATSLPFNPVCFTGTATEKYLTTGGGLPKATYIGNEYTSAPAGCGYTPENVRAAYNLNALYAEGYTGSGQTIVIIDWCGSPTIQSDANAFSKQFGLPALTKANFQIIYTPTASTCAAPDPEINIDVEWAHAIAPGAAIDLVVPPSATFQDTDEAYFYAVDYGLGNVISGSYGSEEIYTPESVLITEDLISETAAVLGISANFSTGDDGDFTYDEPLFNPPSVSAPADSPWVTGVGGVSLALNPNNTIAWQSGWGTNFNLLDDEGFVTDPPSGNGYFDFGSGGGQSAFFLKPTFQSSVRGSGRMLPDVSWLADPYTGAYIAISEPGVLPELQYQVYGGTSLACPMFAALWAIANQEAGEPLGQAAPYLYSMSSAEITDILPYASKTNVIGQVKDSAGLTNYTVSSLAAPLDGSADYVTALWSIPLYEDTSALLTFGTDSGLKTTRGWDDVTGVGVPNAKAFADYFKQ